MPVTWDDAAIPSASSDAPWDEAAVRRRTVKQLVGSRERKGEGGWGRVDEEATREVKMENFPDFVGFCFTWRISSEHLKASYVYFHTALCCQSCVVKKSASSLEAGSQKVENTGCSPSVFLTLTGLLLCASWRWRMWMPLFSTVKRWNMLIHPCCTHQNVSF